MMETDIMATYVHPSISSTITDNSATYVTADGTTKLFAVFTSYKGKDNEIKMITSVSEYEFNYGEPNIKKYGQVGYNVINWLNSGGVVYCLRVLPEDAGYANAIVNIQTKTGTKMVAKADGTLVEVPDVTIRPTVTATSINNTSESSIQIDELRRATTNTIDGYKNNMIFAVIPKGRGEGYNNLGFRISLLSNYDSTYDFRLYNFEVTQVSDSGSTSTIQGPFVVSLDPDALSLSGESMFIESVISKYCDYFTIIFDEANYEELGEIINPNVNPNRIDFFSGVTKVIDDVTETYYEPLTDSEEDIHMYITKYTNDGVASSERNIVDADDVIEAEIVNYDNSYRTALYNRYEDTAENLKLALSKLKKVTASSNPIQSYLADDISYLQNDTTLEDLTTRLNDANTNMIASPIEENYNTLVSALNDTENVFNKELDTIYKVFDFSKINGSNDVSVALQVSLKEIESGIYNVKNTSIKFSSITSELVDIENTINNAKLTEMLDSEEETMFAEIINATDDMVKVLNNVTTNSFASNSLSDVETVASVLLSNYTEMVAPYVLEEDYNASKELAYLNAELLVEKLKLATKYVLAELKTDKFITLQSALNDAKVNVLVLADDMIAKSSAGEITVSDVVNIIDSFQTTLESAKQDTYFTILQNFDNNIKLRYGSDGEITGKTYTDSAVERLIVKGYTGTIDNRLLDKSMFPIDVVLDANYSVNIKNAIVTLTTEIRNDFVAMLDTKFQATPEQAIAFRRNSLSVNNFRLSIWAQDFVVTDAAYTGLNMQVTSPYFLASKIPTNDNANGIHWNFVGPRRGTISGFESISYLPNPEWKEQMYGSQVNYVEQDLSSTRFGCQLTSQSQMSALSNVNNVRALLRIQRDVEELMAQYQFEYNDSTTRSAAQLALNSYLNQWITNRACDSISGTVYASDYDRLSKILRVKIEMTFNSIIERIAIDLIVNN